MRTPRSRSSTLLTLGAPALLAGAALAAFTMDTAPTWRGDAGTELGGWESFTSAYLGENVPDEAGSTSGAVLVQTVPGAVITSGGNIYNPAGASRFEVRDAVDCDLQEVWLQVSTWGEVLERDGARLVFHDCLGAEVSLPPSAITVLASYPNPSGLGLNEELLFEWDLAAEPADLRAYTIHFEAAAAHLSLDALILDARTDCASLDDCDLGVAYCFGDGSGPPCPCGNDGAAGHGCANSTTPGAELSAFGTSSVSAGDLVLRGTGLVGSQPALFFQGENALPGQNFGDGLRCAGSNVARIEVAFPTAGEVTSSANVAAEGGVAPGETRYYQLWYRDPVPASPCGSGFNLSNGLEIGWTP